MIARKSFIRVVVAISFSGIVACSEPADTSDNAITAEFTSADRKSPTTTLHRGNVAEPDTLDPHKMTTVYENVIGRDLFCSVTDYAADGTVIPACAESWDISDDGLKYTFHLRQGLTWSDGVPVTAADYAAGLHRVFDPATASEQAAILDMIKNGEAISHGKMPVSELGVRAIDDLTFEVELARPSPSYLATISGPRGAPLPRHTFAKFGDDWVQPENIISMVPSCSRTGVPTISLRS